MKDFRGDPPGAPTTSTSPQTLPDCHSSQAAARLAASRISDPRFSARSRPPTISTPRTHFSVRYSLHQSQASSSGQCRCTVCVTKRSKVSQQASRLLRCLLSSYHSSATMRKFCLHCDTIDDRRRSTRRLHDVDTCATDLRLEMAHLSQCGLSVLVIVKPRTTENKRACASNCALTSTSLSLHKSGSNGLFHTSSCLKHIDFLKVKVPDTVSHNERICPPLRPLSQSVDLKYQRSAPVVQVSKYILRIPNPATKASSVHASQPRCNSHGFSPRIRTALNEGFSCWIKQSDSPSLSDQRVVCVCV